MFNNGATLRRAAEMGDLKVVEAELKKGVAVDSVESAGQTGLMYATAKGKVPVVELLLRAKASVNHKAANTGRTALHIASYYGEHMCVEVSVVHVP